VNGRAASDGLHTAANRVSESARQVRGLATDLLHKSEGEENVATRVAADTLGAMSASLEAVAESARASGFVLRDRGRDAARALGRGERLLRERGLTGAAIGTAALVQRHARAIGLSGAAVIALAVMRRRRNRENH
jgi:hypothetical protein